MGGLSVALVLLVDMDVLPADRPTDARTSAFRDMLVATPVLGSLRIHVDEFAASNRLRTIWAHAGRRISGVAGHHVGTFAGLTSRWVMPRATSLTRASGKYWSAFMTQPPRSAASSRRAHSRLRDP